MTPANNHHKTKMIPAKYTIKFPHNLITQTNNTTNNVCTCAAKDSIGQGQVLIINYLQNKNEKNKPLE